MLGRLFLQIPQTSSFCVSLGSGVQGCCLSLCYASARSESQDWSASPPRPCGKDRLRIAVPYHAIDFKNFSMTLEKNPEFFWDGNWEDQ